MDLTYAQLRKQVLCKTRARQWSHTSSVGCENLDQMFESIRQSAQLVVVQIYFLLDQFNNFSVVEGTLHSWDSISQNAIRAVLQENLLLCCFHLHLTCSAFKRKEKWLEGESTVFSISAAFCMRSYFTILSLVGGISWSVSAWLWCLCM